MRTKPTLSTRARGTLLVAATATLWGTSGPTAAILYRHGVGPLTVTFWRMALGAAVLLPLLHRRRSGPGDRPAGGSVVRPLVGAGSALAAYQAGYFLAVDRAGVSLATLVTLGLAPVLVTVVDRLRRGAPGDPVIAGAVVLALAGLLALVGLPQEAGPGVLAGVAMAAVAAGAYAGLAIWGGGLSRRIGRERLTAYGFATSAVLLAPAAALTGGLSLGREPVVLLAMLYLGVVPTAIAYRWFYAGLERIPAGVAAILALLEPLVATVIAVAFLGEGLVPRSYAGGALLLVAVLVVSFRTARSRPT